MMNSMDGRVSFHTGLPPLHYLEQNLLYPKGTLHGVLVLDDFQSQLERGPSEYADIYSVYSHQHHFSVITTLHSIFQPSDRIRRMGKNCTHLILIDTPRYRRGLSILSSQIFNDSSIIPTALGKEIEENGRYSYVLLDMRSGVPDNYRLRSGIFDDEDYGFFTTPTQKHSRRI